MALFLGAGGGRGGEAGSGRGIDPDSPKAERRRAAGGEVGSVAAMEPRESRDAPDGADAHREFMCASFNQDTT